jgi:Holliday junction DNA helicase RuvA
MITKIHGRLNTLHDDRLRLQVGPLEYELFIADTTRQHLQTKVGDEVTLHTSHYLEAGAMQSRFVPRLLGFMHEAELEFFELFCTVEKIGAKKALKAMARPVPEIADAIQREDVKYLAKLPGLGAATAEKIVAALRKKVVKFLLLRGAAATLPTLPTQSVEERVIEEVYQGLLALGHAPAEARALLAQATADHPRFGSAEELLQLVYAKTH